MILDSESFGVAAVEAMACEVPIIVSDAGGLKEVVINNETGFVVPRKNEKEIAKKIKEYILNEELRNKFIANGRRRVLEEYDWDKNVDYMIQVYKEIIDGK